MEKTVSIAEGKNKFSDLVNRAVSHHERIHVSKRGKPIAVIMSLQDLMQIEEREKRRLLKRLKAIEKTTKKYIPYEQFVREYEKKWGVDLDSIEPEE